MSSLGVATIQETAFGRSFLEVGGLWGTVNEKCTTAMAAGASAVTMVDAAPAGDVLWTRFLKRAPLGSVEMVSGDFVQLAHTLEPHDIVYSTGVLYHHPNPLRFLQKLRTVTKFRAIVGTVVLPATIRNSAGTFELSNAGALFVPALAEQELGVLRRYWTRLADPALGQAIIGITEPADYTSTNFDAWWWLFRPEVFKAACRATGWNVLAEQVSWPWGSMTLVLEPR